MNKDIELTDNRTPLEKNDKNDGGRTALDRGKKLQVINEEVDQGSTDRAPLKRDIEDAPVPKENESNEFDNS